MKKNIWIGLVVLIALVIIFSNGSKIQYLIKNKDGYSLVTEKVYAKSNKFSTVDTAVTTRDVCYSNVEESIEEELINGGSFTLTKWEGGCCYQKNKDVTEICMD